MVQKTKNGTTDQLVADISLNIEATGEDATAILKMLAGNGKLGTDSPKPTIAEAPVASTPEVIEPNLCTRGKPIVGRVCAVCKTQTTPQWRRLKMGRVCNKCYHRAQASKKHEKADNRNTGGGGRKWTPELKKQLIDLRLSGKTSNQIASEMNRSRKAIEQQIMRIKRHKNTPAKTREALERIGSNLFGGRPSRKKR